ncbi:CBL-interacting protein kinase 14 [Panicum miliaceum]|uniref:CBL-interacting protein kinase 14 n=1 Tax=Panicum miliaceum TaxID=4540 RepID=A0A3L6QQD8_PANMI|nr:CBL-interacting protein kinase 14 [Panicum miliaceum]
MLHSHALGGSGERGSKAVLLRRRKNWATTSHTENDPDLTLEAAAAEQVLCLRWRTSGSARSPRTPAPTGCSTPRAARLTPSYVAPAVLKANTACGTVAPWVPGPTSGPATSSCSTCSVLLVDSLPFHDDNLMVMLQRGHLFLCPPWVSTDAGELIGKLVDPPPPPNPRSRIAVDRLVETPWFQKTSPVPAPLKAPAPEPPSTDARRDDDKEEPEAQNAFHLSQRASTCRRCSAVCPA